MAEFAFGQQIVTPPFTLVFSNLTKPNEFAGTDPSFGFTMLFDQNVDLRPMKKALHDIEKEFFKSANPAYYKDVFKDGNTRISAEGDVYPGHENRIAVKASIKAQNEHLSKTKKPLIWLSRSKELLSWEAAAEMFYDGCICDAKLTPMAYNIASKGVKFIPKMIRFREQGEPLFADSMTTDDFDDLEDSQTSEFDDI